MVDDRETLSLVFFDVETTGLNPHRGDAICEIGAVKLKNEEIIDKFQTLVNPKRKIPLHVSSIHNIYDEDVKDAPYFEEVIDSFLAFLKDSIIAGYNICFDLSFLNEELAKMGYPSLNVPALDVLKMAKRTLNLKYYNLGYLTQYLRIKAERYHRALEDAYLTSQVFLKIRDILYEKGIRKMEEIILLFGVEDFFYKKIQQPLLTLFKESIEEKIRVKVRYFSSSGVKEYTFFPLKLMENTVFGKDEEGELFLRLNQILDVEIL